MGTGCYVAEVKEVTHPDDKPTTINLTKAEIESGLNRIKMAEGLIQQLPKTHNGRNTWLMNYGISTEATGLRMVRDLKFNYTTMAAETFSLKRESDND